jgi:starch synthase
MVEDNPKYQVSTVVPEFSVPLAGGTRKAFVKQTKTGDVPVYMVGGPDFFRDATESKKVYACGATPYIFFCRAVVEAVKQLGWVPDVIHCNDWHTGLVPVYLRSLYANDPAFRDTGVVFTIHNLAYQGEFDIDVLDEAGLPRDLYTMDKLECYGRVNFLKGGLVYSDLVNTVSETYAKEIQTEEYGSRLEGLLRYMAANGKLRGILNGIDYSDFNPQTDKRIAANYDCVDLAGKWENKGSLQEALGLPVDARTPVFGLVSRLVDQKGLDLLKDIAAKLMKLDMQMVILGTGDPAYEKYFKGLEQKHPDKVSATIGFDAVLAQKIYAGSDFFLMPSRFEPCGLGQMISLRYGTIPVVRATGGLGDTIEEYDVSTGSGNGFVFSEYDSKKLLASVKRALAVYADEPAMSKLVSNAMECDFSAGRAAKHYAEFYAAASSIVLRGERCAA